MRQEHNCEQGGEKQPIKKLGNLSRIVNKVFQDLQTSKKFTSPGISIGKAAKDSITSDADIATVFLSTTTSPMLSE
jgi:hypothetical protein